MVIIDLAARTAAAPKVLRQSECQAILTVMLRVFDLEALPADPLEALTELSQAGVELDALLRDQVAAARRTGASWAQIGERLGMSRQAAWEYYTRDVRQVLGGASGDGDALGEEEALELAVQEVSDVRRRRRRTS